MKRSVVLLILAALTIFAMVACNNDTVKPDTDAEASAPETELPAPALVYEVHRHLYQEPEGGKMIGRDLYMGEAEYGFYGFEESVADTVRSDCAQVTEALLHRVGYSEKPAVYVYSNSSLKNIYISDGVLYTYPRDWRTAEYAADVLLAMLGEDCNYGAVYGYAHYLCSSLGWDKEEISLAETENMAVYDLNLLCFNEKFVTSADICAAKYTSVAFVYDYIRKNGETAMVKLIKASGERDRAKDFSDALGLYYNEVGIEHLPGTLGYSYGGFSYDYIVHSPYATFYLRKDWWEQGTSIHEGWISDNFLHENYSEIKDYFETVTDEMGKYQSLFGRESYDNSLTVLFANQASSNSFYQPHRIEVCALSSLSHEYVHSLAWDSGLDMAWESEGFATWYDFYYDTYGTRFLNVDYNSDYVMENETISRYRENVGRPLDMAVDFRHIYHAGAAHAGYTHPNQSYGGYNSGASFTGFLVETYGDSTVIDFIYSGGEDYSGYFGRTYDELVSDWREFLTDNYSEYKKN